ncbi:MAG: potassium transporter TrkA [Chloroflexi bacterium]|nr:potassium transporter TrkA [Chloroflexota bacterium]
MTVVVFAAAFFLIAIAAGQIGKFLSRFQLPYITGYLLAGVIAGPFVLGLLPEGASDQLRFIDEVSLGIIAFVAGSELYLKELESRLRAVLSNTLGIVLITFTIASVALFFLTELIPFTAGMDVTNRIAVAILGGTILLALSPASTIAVMREVNARGPFTRTVLSVTVMMDVFGIILFAIAVAIASALLTGLGFDLSFIGLLALDLGAAAAVGLIAGKLLELGLSLKVPRLAKIIFILTIGFLIFLVAVQLVEISHALFPFEIHIEPILVAMIAGFFVTNFTSQRQHFDELLHEIGPFVYIAFFTLTGVSLKLDVLTSTILVALALFVIRVVGIFLGSNLGGLLAGEPAKFRSRFWMGFITQAGIALGLAREVAVEFPTLGDAFATLVISVVVLNEIVGPLFLKAALRQIGEAYEPDKGQGDEKRDAVILGIEEQSLALGRYLADHGWEITLADVDQNQVETAANGGLECCYITHIDHASFKDLVSVDTDALVAMLSDDDLNLKASQIAKREFGVDRIVVRLNDLSRAAEFRELGATFVDPTSAMVNLLGQAVRAPQSAALLLHTDPTNELVQITITNPEISGTLVRDLRLPVDVLLLAVNRDGQSIVPNGYTPLRLKDEVTLLGSPERLHEATLQLGY